MMKNNPHRYAVKISTDAFNALQKIAEANKLAWFWLMDCGNGYATIIDLDYEEGREMPFKEGLEQLNESIVDPLAEHGLTVQQINAYVDLLNEFGLMDSRYVEGGGLVLADNIKSAVGALKSTLDHIWNVTLETERQMISRTQSQEIKKGIAELKAQVKRLEELHALPFAPARYTYEVNIGGATATGEVIVRGNASEEDIELAILHSLYEVSYEKGGKV